MEQTQDPVDMRRRNAVQLSLLAALRTVLPLSGVVLASCDETHPRPQPKILPSAVGIDVHCHAFNGRDLPVAGFVLHVVLEKNPLADLQLGSLVTFLALLIDLGTRGTDSEIMHLQNGTEPGLRAGASPAAVTPIDAGLYDLALQAAIALQAPDARSLDIIDQVKGLLPSHGTLRSVDPTPFFLNDLAHLTPGGPVPGLDPAIAFVPEMRMGTSPRLTRHQAAEAAAQGVLRHAANKSGVFYLAELVTRPRAELVRRLITLPTAGEDSGIALVTPAMIDFSYWLDHRANHSSDLAPAEDPADVSPLADQIKVMSVIAGLKVSNTGKVRRYAVHPFVSFCPWRQIAEQSRGVAPDAGQFAAVKDAIRNKGFIGVKLYPVMGFRPTGNAREAPSSYPRRLQLLPDWAANMDRALADLYHFCVAEDVPVMAHCSYSQYPNPAAGRRGGPAGWWEVLEQWPKLRLNLAHCGGVWDLAPEKARIRRQQAGDLWPIDIIPRLGQTKYPNLYADLADFDGVLACQAALPVDSPTCQHSLDGEPLLIRLAKEVNCNPAARKRIMYGTDYMFLIQASGTENYLMKMRDCLAPSLQMAPDDLMGLNAARFLGLSNPTSGTRQRLDRFRGDDFLSRWTI